MRMVVFGFGALLSLSACGVNDRLEGRGISHSGAGTVLAGSENVISECALATLIKNSAERANDGATSFVDLCSKQFAGETEEEKAARLQDAIVSFDQASVVGARSQTQLRNARNTIQGYVISASSNRCNAFKNRLREQSTSTTFGLGSLAVGLSAAGAVISGGASQVLSGLAGGTSGINAEYNRDIMSGLTSGVIIPGIDVQRTAIMQEISNRRCLGVGSYPLTYALADAIRFHSACSTDVGIAVASSAISQTRTQTLAEVRDAIEAANGVTEELRKSATKPDSKPKQGAAGNAAPAQAPENSQESKEGTNHTPPSKTPLLGQSINLLQCPPLDPNGLLTSGLPGSGPLNDTGGQVVFGIVTPVADSPVRQRRR